MNYSKENLVRTACNQLNEDELNKALDAITGFTQLFGKTWVDEYFKWEDFINSVKDVNNDPMWLENHFMIGSLPILSLASYWENWYLVRNAKGAEKVCKRWKHGTRSQGVISEVFFAANMIRAGAEIELEPTLASGKVSDCRFRFGDDAAWIYAEVSIRGETTSPKEVLRSESIRVRAAEAAAKVMPGRLGQVVILRRPKDDEIENIFTWLRDIQSPEEQSLDDLAVFWIGPQDQCLPGDLNRQFELLPMHFAVSSYCEAGLLGMACLSTRDSIGICNKITNDERIQLDAHAKGVIVIDVTKVEGFKWLDELANEVFQTPINAQISGLIFFKFMWPSTGPKVESKVFFNPSAINPLSLNEQTLLRDTFSNGAVLR